MNIPILVIISLSLKPLIRKVIELKAIIWFFFLRQVVSFRFSEFLFMLELFFKRKMIWHINRIYSKNITIEDYWGLFRKERKTELGATFEETHLNQIRVLIKFWRFKQLRDFQGFLCSFHAQWGQNIMELFGNGVVR